MNQNICPTTQTIAQALSCGEASCQCHRPPANNRRMTHCPAHSDRIPSLSLEDGPDGRVLVHCFAGCSQEAVIAALQKRGLWPGVGEGGAYPSVTPVTVLPPPPDPAPHEGKTSQKGVTPPVADNAAVDTGLTTEALARAKKLPLEFLKAQGLCDFRGQGQPSVRIPYADIEGNVAAVRFRLSLDGSRRFTWRRGDHPLLYGLERLPQIRQDGWVLLVEGESDCWTAWYHRLPALGLPGKTTWRPEWAAYLDGLAVYLWQEPDADDLVPRLAVDIPGLMVIPAPDGTKDLSEAYLRGEDIVGLLARLRAQSSPATGMLPEAAIAQLDEVYQQAAPVLASRDPLQLITQALVDLGYGGDLRPPTICYLAATSRLLRLRPGALPCHLLLTGPSGVGKSWTWNVVRRLLPPEAYHQIDAASRRALIYDTADLKHRVLAVAEADSLPTSEDNPAASAIRNLLQDGLLHYKVTVRDTQSGEFKVKDVSKQGPSVLITTATRPLGEQLSTRLFTLEVSSDPAQIQAVLRTQAQLEQTGLPDPDHALVAFQQLLQALAPWDVVVPYAEPLSDVLLQQEVGPRLARDFARLLSLIKAVAILRYRHRSTDDQQRVIAQIEDYATVRDLVADMYQATVTGASATTRGVVETVSKLVANKGPNDRVNITQVARYLGVHKAAVTRPARAALRNGWLVNNETRKGYPFDLALGEPLPGSGALPEPSALGQGVAVGVTPRVTPSHLRNDGGCNTVTPLTDGEHPPHPSPP